ncbi:MAG: hypothetical protein Q7V14_02775 [Coriobacteriia bacterium]|nr:hypothetical protein [Coriobacteriia bacterium]
MSIEAIAIDALSPLLGKAMATVYVAQAALSRGEIGHELDLSELHAFCDEIRSKISPFSTRSLVDDAIAEIVSAVRA